MFGEDVRTIARVTPSLELFPEQETLFSWSNEPQTQLHVVNGDANVKCQTSNALTAVSRRAHGTVTSAFVSSVIVLLEPYYSFYYTLYCTIIFDRRATGTNVRIANIQHLPFRSLSSLPQAVEIMALAAFKVKEMKRYLPLLIFVQLVNMVCADHGYLRDSERKLPVNDYLMFDGDFTSFEQGFVAAFLLIVLLVILLCCCCCNGCSLWDILACFCLWELCCDHGAGGIDSGFVPM